MPLVRIGSVAVDSEFIQIIHDGDGRVELWMGDDAPGHKPKPGTARIILSRSIGGSTVLVVTGDDLVALRRFVAGLPDYIPDFLASEVDAEVPEEGAAGG